MTNENNEIMPAREEYKLTLTHNYIGFDGKIIRMEDPKVFSYNIGGMNCYENGDIGVYRSHVIRELFERFMYAVLREVEE